MASLRQFSHLLPWLALAGGVLLVGLFDPSFLNPSTLLGLMAGNVTLFLMAIGMTFVIYLGSIDLSMQSVAAASSVVLALLLPVHGWIAIPLALAVGAAFGLISGMVLGLLRIPSFVATLATGGVATSFALWFSGERAVAIMGANRNDYLGWVIGTTAGVPNEIWVALVALLIALVVEQATPFGKMMKAVGCSEPAANVAGIRVRFVKVVGFTLAGAFAGFAGVVLAARLSSGSPTIANEFLLPAIAAVVLGGTSLTGGTGGVLRTLAGTMLITVIRTGMTFVGVDAFAQQIVFGTLLVLAVGLNAGRMPKNVMK